MKTVLIVEDTPLNLELLVQLLEEQFTLMSAGDGRSGVALARKRHPDLILMDMSLPVLDGWGAVAEIRRDALIGSTPIIGLSAHAMQGDAARALEVGCDAYLTKPVDEGQLMAAIERLLEI